MYLILDLLFIIYFVSFLKTINVDTLIFITKIDSSPLSITHSNFPTLCLTHLNTSLIPNVGVQPCINLVLKVFLRNIKLYVIKVYIISENLN